MPRPAKAKPAPQPSAESLLASLTAAATPVVAKPSKDKDRTAIRLTGEEAEQFDMYASACTINKLAEANSKLSHVDAIDIARRKWLRMCIDRSVRVENPVIITDNCTANFQIKNLAKIKTTGPTGQVVSYAEQLQSLGLPAAVIEDIMVNVIKDKMVVRMKPFNELLGEESTLEQKAVAAKVMAMLNTGLTKAEKELVLEAKAEATVANGWQQKAVAIAVASVNKDDDGWEEQAVDVLNSLLTVIAPQFVLAQVVFNGQLSDALKRIDPAGRVEKAQVITSSDGKYKIEIKGNELTLFSVKADGEKKMGKKVCSDPGHALNSASKAFRVPAYLNTLIADLV